MSWTLQCTMYANEASGSGGGLCAEGAGMEVSNTSIHHNTAEGAAAQAVVTVSLRR